MSFLSKLKERLFKSSSKIDDGLEAIMDDDVSQKERTEDNMIIHGDEITRVNEGLGNEIRVLKTIDPDVSEVEDKITGKKNFLSNFIKKVDSTQRRRVVDDKLLESLEELLISADLGVKTAVKISSSFAESQYGKKLSVTEIKILLAAEVKKILEPVSKPISISSEKLQVLLVVGVNGSGKTTTIGKLANQFKTAKKSVTIVAADTFRAAAVEQLEVWGQRSNVPVRKGAHGSDPAALAYDSMVDAIEKGTDILIIDTAGRLQNKSDLMEELAKIVRVLKKLDPEAPHNTLLVLDASTGQNAISQVEIFKKTADISGLIMTKLDGTAKGGILVALADRFKLPIHAIGIGESIDDLQPFDPEEFTLALTGVEDI